MDRRNILAMLAVMPVAPALAAGSSAHDHVFESIDGGPLSLGDFAGRPVLVVNTASHCGFTPQYDGLQALYDRYRGEGLVVLGVPSDDFGGQEYDTEAEVKNFCAVNFNLDFPMTSITKVRGAGAHPFYQWARETLGQRNAPGWNFHKYLIGPDGAPVAAFTHTTRPMAPRLTKAVEALLD